MSSPVQLLKQSFDELSRTNKKIAKYVMENPQAASEANIEDLAEVTETSTASVSRLVKTLGYGTRSYGRRTCRFLKISMPTIL